MKDGEMADHLEAMTCTAPRAGCHTGRICDCIVLRDAAARLRKIAESEQKTTRWFFLR
jgi:hypothetical protein